MTNRFFYLSSNYSSSNIFPSVNEDTYLHETIYKVATLENGIFSYPLSACLITEVDGYISGLDRFINDISFTINLNPAIHESTILSYQ